MDRTLVAGTLIQATIHGARRDTPGATLTATVSADVTNAHRSVVIPAGCLVRLSIARRGPAMVLEVTSVRVEGQVYPVSATAVASGTRILFVLPEGFTAARRLGATP
jgi:hypothetical protein